MLKRTILLAPEGAVGGGTATTTAPASSSPGVGASAPAKTENLNAGFEEVFADIDKADEASGKQAAQKPAAKPAETQKPTEKGQKPAETKPEVAKAPDKTQAATEQKPERAKELRAAYDGLKEKVKGYESELTGLRAKVQEYEKNGGGQTKELQDKVAGLEKQNAELLEEVRYQNAEKDPDFKKNHLDPYNEQWAEAVGEIEQLTVTLDDGSTRKGTANDLLALCDTPRDQLAAVIRARFGEDEAADVLMQVKSVRKLAAAAEKARAELRAKGGERAKEMEARHKQFLETLDRTWKDRNGELMKQHPDWFGPTEGDTEGNSLLQRTTAFVDEVFLNSKLNPLEKAKRSAEVRNMAIAAPKFQRQLKLANDRISELEKELADYQKSSPNGGLGSSPGGEPHEKSIEDEIDEADRANRNR